MNPESMPEPQETAFEYPLMQEGESLDDYFLRAGEQVPHVKIELYSAAHMNYEDSKGVREMMPNADIFIPEGVGWKESDLDRKNDISVGKEDDTLKRAREKGIETADFGRASEDALSGTGIPVVSVDLPHEEVVEREKLSAFKPDRNDRLPYEESLRVFKEGREKFAKNQLEREQYMRTHLGPKILQALRMKPELRGQNEIIVLMPLGAAHTDIFHKLKDTGTDINRTYQTSPYIYPHETEYQHRIAFGRDVDPELIERSFIEGIIFKGLNGVSNKHATPEGQLFKRIIVGLLDANDRREYFAAYQNLRSHYLDEANAKRKQFKSEFGENWQEPYRNWSMQYVDGQLKDEIGNALRTILQRKGITVPANEDEEIKFLHTHAPTEIAYIEQVKNRNLKETGV